MTNKAHKRNNRKNNGQNYVSRNKSTKASPPVAMANVVINIESAIQNLKTLSTIYSQKTNYSDTRGFLTDLRTALGIPNARGASKYGVVQGKDFISSISLTNHNSNAKTYIDNNANYPYNLRIMVRRRFRKNTFKAHPEVNLQEFVYFGQNMAKCTNGNPYVLIIEGLVDFLCNGVYGDKTGIAITNQSPSITNNNQQDTNMKTENRKRNAVRLTESQLKQMIAESVKNVLNEANSSVSPSVRAAVQEDYIELKNNLIEWVNDIKNLADQLESIINTDNDIDSTDLVNYTHNLMSSVYHLNRYKVMMDFLLNRPEDYHAYRKWENVYLFDKWSNESWKNVGGLFKSSPDEISIYQ